MRVGLGIPDIDVSTGTVGMRANKRSWARKTTPAVAGGRVLKKNRTGESPSLDNTEPTRPEFVRQSPGKGYKHLLLKRDMERFVGLLPNWEELSRGLRYILLDAGGQSCYGWHRHGIVALCAWDRELWQEYDPDFFAEHREVFERIGVPHERQADGYRCLFTESTARAFQLLHILLHELGHHHDRMTTRSRRDAARGEPYAERYAREFEQLIFERYVSEFEPL